MKNYLKTAVMATCLMVALGANQALAQKVYAIGGKVYIDCGPDSGFPQDAATAVSKIQAGTPTNTTLFLPAAINGENGTINATVYRRFEVAKTDVIGLDWATAYRYCRDSYPATGGGTGWRLPTQRELMLVWIFRSALTDLGCTALGSSPYWSATEIIATVAWYVHFNYGNTVNTSKATISDVRCVREGL